MFTHTHLTVVGSSSSVGLTDAALGYHAETEAMAAHVVVDGHFETEQEVRAAYLAQFGVRSPI
jgi:hypothetical protein